MVVVAVSAETGHDLSSIIGKHLDRHLYLDILDFLSKQKVYPEDELSAARFALLKQTKRINLAIEEFKRANPGKDEPKELIQAQEAVFQQANELTKSSKNIMALLEDNVLVDKLRKEKAFNLNHLHQSHNISAEDVNELHKFARFIYDFGNYRDAAGLLFHLRSGMTTSVEQTTSAAWGRLAANIKAQQWEMAKENWEELLEDFTSQQDTDPLMLLQQRTWLLHWGLFVFFNKPKKAVVASEEVEQDQDAPVEKVIDERLIETYLLHPCKQTIQTNAPHLLRYLTVAVIILRRRKEALRPLIEMIQQEANNYTDPILQFFQAVYSKFEFDSAQQKMIECEAVFKNDYFLHGFWDLFLEQARRFLFEVFCQIHQRIDIKMLSERLHMSMEDAERWIVDLIRNASLKAKIDSETNVVMMMDQRQRTPYEQVILKARHIENRMQAALAELNKRENSRQVGASHTTNASKNKRQHHSRPSSTR